MNALAELRKRARPAANLANLANRQPQPAPDSQDSRDSQGVQVETAICTAPATGADHNRTRTDLLALADRLGLDRALVHRLTTVDVDACNGLPETILRAYLLALDDTATRWAGKVPADETAPIYCERCGSVWTHPDVAAVLPVVDGWPRALGCRWCFIRKAGGYIPRPLVTCDTCASFQPDTVNPGAGMGTCACGMRYPMQPHRCDKYQPKGSDHD